jgi:hypothetical protein
MQGPYGVMSVQTLNMKSSLLLLPLRWAHMVPGPTGAHRCVHRKRTHTKTCCQLVACTQKLGRVPASFTYLRAAQHNCSTAHACPCVPWYICLYVVVQLTSRLGSSLHYIVCPGICACVGSMGHGLGPKHCSHMAHMAHITLSCCLLHESSTGLPVCLPPCLAVCMCTILLVSACPLQEDMVWREQLSAVTGPVDQDGVPPLDRKV